MNLQQSWFSRIDLPESKSKRYFGWFVSSVINEFNSDHRFEGMIWATIKLFISFQLCFDVLNAHLKGLQVISFLTQLYTLNMPKFPLWKNPKKKISYLFHHYLTASESFGQSVYISSWVNGLNTTTLSKIYMFHN